MVVAVAAVVAAAVVVVLVVAAVLGTPAYKLARAKVQPGPSHYLPKEKMLGRLYSTCASPVVPHLSTRHAHGCLASEIGRDPAFPTRFDRTVSSPEVSLLTPSRHTIGRWKGTGCKNRRKFSKELRGNRERVKQWVYVNTLITDPTTKA